MAKAQELVTEFRETVDLMISDQVYRAQSGPIRESWPGFDKKAEAAGLIFESVDSADVRSSALGLERSQHTWGVHTGKSRFENRTGYLAIVSYAEEPDSLFRRITYPSDMQMFSASTQRAIGEPEEIQAALNWVKSPHLNNHTLARLAILSPAEEAKIDTELANFSMQQQGLVAALERIARARRVPIPNYIIN